MTENQEQPKRDYEPQRRGKIKLTPLSKDQKERYAAIHGLLR